MTVKLTPRQMVSNARVEEMLDTARQVKGFGFAEVANAVVNSRRAMMLFDFSGGRTAGPEARLRMARCLMSVVRGTADAHQLAPGQFAEAILHGNVIFRESIRA